MRSAVDLFEAGIAELSSAPFCPQAGVLKQGENLGVELRSPSGVKRTLHVCEHRLTMLLRLTQHVNDAY